MNTLTNVNDLQPLFWRLATTLVLTACVLIIVACALSFLFELVFRPLRGAFRDADVDSTPDAQARLDAAYRAGSDVPPVHRVPPGVARVGPARHTVNRQQTQRRNT